MSEDPRAADSQPQQDGPQSQHEAMGAPEATAPLPGPVQSPQSAQPHSEHWIWSRHGHQSPTAPEQPAPQQAQAAFAPWAAHHAAAAPHAATHAFPHAQAKARGRVGRALGLTALVALFATGAGAVGGAGIVYALDHRGGSHSVSSTGTDSGPLGKKGLPAASNGRPMTVAEVAAQVQPEVVQIEVTVPDGHITGSGVILSSDGKILTNNHVVADASSGGAVMQVHLHDGTTLPAAVVATDPDTDLAVIQAKGKTDLPAARLGSSARLVVGQDVVAIGSPMGLEGTVTRGIVSALQRPVAAGGEEGSARTSALEAIQTDASINPGNSGGALVNLQGEVVGINFMIYTLGDRQGQSGSIGLGFAIPIDLAKHVSDQLLQNGKATHASLGVQVQGTDSSASVHGVSVLSVNTGSAAEAAGIAVGSVITKVDGHPVDGTVALVAAVRAHDPGEKIQITYTEGGSGGAERTVPVTLGAA
ncbi:MAG: S1C family serine protease [Segniliparus sp.]|uniref:S1C family serine protease n=1 Tax=Segniliparus sp. TaxID=2804064 RepID=UPI003F2FE395